MSVNPPPVRPDDAGSGGAPDGSQVVLVGVVQSVKLRDNKAGKRYATFAWKTSRRGRGDRVAGDLPANRGGHRQRRAGSSARQAGYRRGPRTVLLDELRAAERRVGEQHPRGRYPRAQGGMDEGSLQSLKALFSRHGGACRFICILRLDPAREAIFLLGNDFRVAPTEGLWAKSSKCLLPARSIKGATGAAI